MACKSKGIVRSSRNCCVVGCFNREAKNPELSFYRFPGRRGEEQRKKLWIAAVNRIDAEGNPWCPTSNSRVCSVHFEGGKKSDDKNSPSYIPSIFPAIYNLAESSNHDISSTTVSAPIRDVVREKDTDGDCDMEVATNLALPATEEFTTEPVKCQEIGCQTDLWLELPTYGTNTFFCWNDGNDGSTQTEIYISKLNPTRSVTIEIETPKKVTVDKSCGPDNQVNPGFEGFPNIQNDVTMRQLAGVSREFFLLLLSFIVAQYDGQPRHFVKIQKENRLLLFLMKIKLGMSFCALGCLFRVSKSSASRIFFQVLETLTLKTKSWIFWPSRESVKTNLPKTLHHYSNCRCIINCTEIPTDTPPTVEQRVMCSKYKGRFSVKFLIVITPDGYVCRVSKGYGGRATDSYITNDSGFFTLIEPNDLVLADKGFSQIQSELSKRNATLVIPPLAFNRQFTETEIDDTYKITSVRIHIERAIQRIRKLRILDHFNVELLPYVDAIMHICCIIANSQPQLTHEN